MVPNITYKKLLNYVFSKTLNPYISSIHTFAPFQSNSTLLGISSYGSSSNWYLNHPTLLFSGLFNSNICLNYCDDFLIKNGCKNVFRCYSGLPDNESLNLCVNEIEKGDRFNGNCENDGSKPNAKANAALETPFSGLGKLFPGEKVRKLVDLERVAQIVDLIKKGEEDLESRLEVLAPDLQIKTSILVFESLNIDKVSGMRFFRWVQSTDNKLHRSADFCGLMICNCGHLNDYETMGVLLKEFSEKKFCLSELAFEFVVPSFVSVDGGAKESIKQIVELLRKTGGSCYSSGIHSLVQLLCALDLFDMAKYVMQITDMKVAYLNILIREKCKRGLQEDALRIIAEMRGAGCHADTKSYNLVLGSLCKMNKMDGAFSVLRDMKVQGVPADALSYEILIYFLCKIGKVNDAYRFFNQMVSEGIRPRLLVHASIIEAFMKVQQCEEAYRYVVDSCVKDPYSSPMIYTNLVKEHRKRGDIMSAQNIILEMMDKGLRPNYNEYMNVVRSLKGQLATDLKNRYSLFMSPSRPPQ